MKWLFLIWLALVPVGGLAEGRLALVFGNDRYEHLRPLANAGADADAIADTLEALGFEVLRERDRDLRRMRRALEDLEYDGTGADVVLIYFAGHGFEVAGDNRLLPVDAVTGTVDTLIEGSLSLNDIRALVARIAKVGIVLVDACREDPFAASGAGRSGVALNGAQTRPGFAAVDKAEGTLVGFATAPGDTASDGSDGHSPFASALIRHLATPGLEVRSVLTLVQQEVYDRTRGDQLPYVESALPRLFFAAQAEDELPERERLLLAMAGLNPDLRAEVEKAAAAANMPLAPLYGALIGAGLARESSDDRARMLIDAARAYTETRERLTSLAAQDAEVSRLRDTAAERLDLGDFSGAMAALDLAAARDRDSGTQLEVNLVARRLSEAESLTLKAGVAKTALDYPVAVAALTQAAALHAGIAGLDVADADRKKRTWLLADLGEINRRLGATDAAMHSYSEMQAAALARLSAAPDNHEAEHDLAATYDRIGEVEVLQGDLPAAQSWYAKAYEINARLVALNPDNQKWQRGLGVSFFRFGEVRFWQGDLQGALTAYSQGLAHSQRRAALTPEDAELQRDIAANQTRIGDVNIALGEGIAALSAFRAALEISEALAALDPADAARQRDVSLSHGRIGLAYEALGDLPATLSAFQDSLAIIEQLLAKDASNTGLQSESAVGQGRIGQALEAQGDLEGALRAYEATKAIQERLVAQDPSNGVWVRDLSVTYNKIGGISRKQGDAAAAYAAFQASLATVQRFADRDPSQATWQRDLVVSNYNLALVGPTPRAHYSRALEIVESMIEKGILAPPDAFMPGLLRKKLEALPPGSP